MMCGYCDRSVALLYTFSFAHLPTQQCPSADMLWSRHNTKQALAFNQSHADVATACYKDCMSTMQLLMTRPRDEWRHDVTSRYRALEQFSKEDARLQFLRILRSLPYGMLLPLSVEGILSELSSHHCAPHCLEGPLLCVLA